MGGFANAWGSGLYEFNDEDLRGFPIQPADLEPYYKRLTGHIGISGGDKLFGDSLVSDGSLLPRFHFLARRRFYTNDRGAPARVSPSTAKEFTLADSAWAY